MDDDGHDSLFELISVIGAKFDDAAKWISLRAMGWGDEGDEEDAKRTGRGKARTQASAVIDEAHYIPPFGLAAFPIVTKTLKALAWFDGHDIVVPWLWDKAKAIVDLAKGETRVYSVGKTSVRIRLKADGSLSIESDGGNIALTATGGDVVLNGGTLRLARETDAVSVTIPINGLVLPVAGGVATGPAAPVTLTGTISAGGAPRARA